MSLFIEITFPLKGKPKINTDVKRERVSDLLVEWVRYQVGQGRDPRTRVDRDVYHIGLDIDLADDSFTVQSDTNNDGLTCGIVMEVIKLLNGDPEEGVEWS